ncbi:MAG: haloacid dehalogenase [Chloroflexi bacterium]|nr:haloacid dehalogenase [Chloroflexota bacterium]
MSLDLEPLAEKIRGAFTAKQASRDQALQLSRSTIRFCANSIRAVHRGEEQQAGALLAEAGEGLRQLRSLLEPHPDLFYMGFVDDAQKEYAEASTLSSLVFGQRVLSPEELNIGQAPYLNGIGEAAGELRRFILDRIRAGEFRRCEEALDAMDEIYRVLVTMDFPDGMTGGLRRTTDMVRGVLERTRGDLTMAIHQRQLIDRLSNVQRPKDA